MPEEDLKQKTKKGVYWTFFNQFANNGLQFVVGIIMARILSPEDYGLTALPAVFFAIAGVFIDSGFAQALVRKPEVSEKDLATSFYYSAIVGIVCFTFIFIGAPFIAEFYNAPILNPMIRVTALTFLWGPLNTPQNIILQRRLDFKTPARISVITKIIGSFVGITFAYLGYGVWALVIMSVISSLLGMVQTWIAVRWLPKERWSKDSFKYLWNYGNKIIATYLIDKVYTNIAPIFIGKYYSPADLGQYNRAQGYANLPSMQITNVLQSVTFPILSKLQENKEVMATKYRQMIKTSCFVVMPIMLLLAALAYPFVIILVGEKWAPCVIFLQLLCFRQSLFPMQMLNVNLLMVSGRSDLYLRLEIMKKVIGFPMMMITLPISVLAFVIGLFVLSLVNLVLNTYYTSKLIGLGFFTQLNDIKKTILLSVFVSAIVYYITLLLSNIYMQAIVGLSVGCIMYLGCSIIFKFEELNDVKYMLSRKSK